jgi:toxin ParE1/3/4
MQKITHYIASELKAPDAALHLLDALEDAIFSLSEFPQRIALTEEEPWHSYGKREQIRKLSQMDTE